MATDRAPTSHRDARRHEPHDLDFRGATARYVPGDDLTPELAERIVQLYRAATNHKGWPVKPGAADRLLWIAQDHPVVGEIALVEHDGEAIGASTPTLEPYRLHGRRLLSVANWHRALDPRWQGTGLYRRFTSYTRCHANPRADFVIGPTTHPAGRSRVGEDRFVLPNRIELYGRPLNARLLAAPDDDDADARSSTPEVLARQQAARFRPRWLRRLAWEWRVRSLAWRARRAPRPESSWTIERVRELDEAFDEFLPAALEPFELYHERTRASLQWRYLDPRGGAFEMYVARGDGEILGYVVVGLSAEDATMADILVRPGRLDVLHSLVDRAVQAARGAGNRSIVCWLTRNHPYRDTVLHLGFVPAPSATVFVYGAFSVDLSDLRAFEDPELDLHLTLGDTNHA